MAADEDDDKLLRTVALRNLKSILQAQQQAEEALRKQSQWLRITLASIGDAVISTDADGLVTFMNGVAEKLTGWTQADALGRALPEVFKIVNDRTRQPVDNPALRALRDGTVVGLANHTVLISRDGTERPIDESAAPIREDAGNIFGAVLVFRDISQRRENDAAQRRAREAAEAERARLAELFDLSPAYTAVLTGPDHVYERANARYYQLVGERDLIGKPVRVAIPEIEGQEYIEILDRVFKTGEPFVGTDKRVLLRRNPDGPLEERFVDFVYQPLRDADGAISGVLSHGIDLTDRKNAEEDQAYLAAIVESSQDAIVGRTLDGRILSWNSGAEKIYGYTADEAIGRPITLIVPAERQDEERMILDRIRRGERVDHIETVRVSKQGRHIDISLTVSPVRDRAGRIVGVSKVARDITDRKQAEVALREADRRKEHFIAMLAHELRNPLAAVGNSLNVLRLAGGDPGATTAARAFMERQHSHMVRLVDDLLDVSRISQNKIELRRSRVQLADVLSSAVETVRPLIDAAGHILTVSLPELPVFLDADLTRLAQVFGNLLSNSAKYTESGGRIVLSGERHGAEVAVIVRDTGNGIPREAIPRIFDMFSQVEGSVERRTGGLGIGLALVKGLVEMHRGTVTAESEGLGRGSSFIVRLPIMGAEPLPIEQPIDEARSEGAPKRRVLVVDDNRDAAISMAMMLRFMGNSVETVYNGRDGVDAAERFRPEIILMDVGMPGLDGYETTRRIREQPWGQKMIILAVTGWGQESDRTKSRDAGCDGHLLKPVILHELEERLVQLTGVNMRADAPVDKG
jgi:PAS domain S-box-containing protein